MEFKFDHVHLICQDVDGMVDFFARIFDAKRISYNPDFKGSASAVILLGNMRIFVRGVRPGHEPEAVAGGRSGGTDGQDEDVEDAHLPGARRWVTGRRRPAAHG